MLIVIGPYAERKGDGGAATQLRLAPALLTLILLLPNWLNAL